MKEKYLPAIPEINGKIRPHEADVFISLNKRISKQLRISNKEFLNLWDSQNGKCYLTNTPLFGGQNFNIGIEKVNFKLRLINYYILYSKRNCCNIIYYGSNNYNDFKKLLEQKFSLLTVLIFESIRDQLHKLINYSCLGYEIYRTINCINCYITIIIYNFNGNIERHPLLLIKIEKDIVSFCTGNQFKVYYAKCIYDSDFDPNLIIKLAEIDFAALHHLKLKKIIESSHYNYFDFIKSITMTPGCVFTANQRSKS